jgi:hypothetical protein
MKRNVLLVLPQSRLCQWTMGLLLVFSYGSASASEPQWWTNQKRACNLSSSLAYNDWVSSGSPCNSGSGGNSNDNGAADRARAEAAAAAQAQRRREAELEQQRIEAENVRRAEEIENQARFIDDRDAAASTLRGSTGAAASGAPGNSELRGSSATPKLRGSTPDTAPTSSLDPRVGDARNVPTGLPKSVAAEIPATPAGDRVRKGFQAIMDHDWNVAHAWFQDALNHDPGNAGIQRLIDLAEYTMKRANHPHASTLPAKPVADTSEQDKEALAALDQYMDDRMNADLAKSLDDFNRNYLPKHPELLMPVKSSASAPTTKLAIGSATPERLPADRNPNWKVFFDSLFTPPRRVLIPTSVGGVRD